MPRQIPNAGPTLEFDRVAMESQLVEKQRTIDYDTKEFTVELLVQKLDNGDFFIPPYQREFIWHDKRRAKFIESVLLGLPIPFMFAADTKDGILEIVDGAQRLRTLREFLDNKLILRDLEQLTNLAGRYFADLPTAQQRKFKNRTLRMVVLADKTTDDAKYDIFQRINTGSDTLRSSEVRKGAYRGPFYSFVEECAGRTDFMELCPVGRSRAFDVRERNWCCDFSHILSVTTPFATMSRNFWTTTQRRRTSFMSSRTMRQSRIAPQNCWNSIG